tara:strand:- start:489 stop:788 length:300 start_codon:yes stop_codon:yes gene_type:complete
MGLLGDLGLDEYENFAQVGAGKKYKKKKHKNKKSIKAKKTIYGKKKKSKKFKKPKKTKASLRPYLRKKNSKKKNLRTKKIKKTRGRRNHRRNYGILSGG